jgi:tetratricopeptide (TPR) repeat protein
MPPIPTLANNTLVGVLDRIGEIHSSRDDCKEIVKVYETAIEKEEMQNWERFRLWDRLGRFYETNSDFEGMVKVFEKAVQIFESLKDTSSLKPTPGWPWDRLGAAYKAKKQHDLAILAYEKAVEMGSQCWNDLWDVYEARGEMNDAIKSVSRLTEAWPTAFYRWDQLARTYRAEGKTDRVVKVFELLMAKDPVASWPCVYIGNELCLKGDLAGAIVAYERAYRNAPPDEGPPFLRPSELPPPLPPVPPPHISTTVTSGPPSFIPSAQSNQPPPLSSPVSLDSPPSFLSPFPFITPHQALPTSMRLSSVYPAMRDDSSGFPTSVLMRLAEIYELSDNYDGAIKVYQGLINQHPHRIWPWARVSRLYNAKAEHDKAINMLTGLRVAHPALIWVRICLGEAYTLKNDFDNAIKTFRDAIDQNLISFWVKYHLTFGSPGGPSPMQTPNIERVTSNYIFYRYLGDVFQAKGDYKAAIEAYQLSIQTAPNKSILFSYLLPSQQIEAFPGSTIVVTAEWPRTFLWKRLGEAYKAIGDVQSATNLYRRAIAVYRDALEAPSGSENWELVWAYSDHGFRETIAILSLTSLALWTTIGEVYRDIGDPAKGLHAFETALKLDPNNQWLKKVVSELRTETVAFESATRESLGEKTVASEPVARESIGNHSSNAWRKGMGDGIMIFGV